MKTAFKLALGLFALSATMASAQGRDRNNDGIPDRRQNGAVVVRPNGAVVVRPQTAPVIVQKPAPRPVIVFRPPPSIPVWTRSFGYSERYHDTCQRKSWRLRWFENRAESDGYLTGGERAEIISLRRDLRRTCGDFRWRG